MSCRFFLLAPYIKKKAHDWFRGQMYMVILLATGCTTSGKFSVFYVFL